MAGAIVFYAFALFGLGGGLVLLLLGLVVGGMIGFAGYRRSCRGSELDHTEPSPTKVSPEKSAPEPTRPTEPAPKKTIFVSYRRDDSADVTGRIYDRLSSRFGSAQVFKDVDSIPLGRDFREVVDDAVAKASVVVVVVGKDWLGVDASSGEPRIHDATDFVRAEVSTALAQGKPVIPVFVAGANMPQGSDLPDDMQDITFRNGVKVRPDPDFAHDVERLIRGIEQA